MEPDNVPIREFCDYVFANYIEDDCKFPPSIWAEYSASITRTTNACESFNSKLNKCFCAPHSNIFTLLEALLEVQVSVYGKMFDVHRAKQRGAAMLKEHDVGVIMTRRETADIDRLQFVKLLSFKFMSPASL